MQVKKFITKSGQEVELSKVTVVIGPNNSGKSQTLIDINSWMTTRSKLPVIIEQLEHDFGGDFEQILAMGNPEIDKRDERRHRLMGLGSSLLGSADQQVSLEGLRNQFENSDKSHFLQVFGNFLIGHLTADRRLQIAKEVDAVRPSREPPQSLLHVLYRFPDMEVAFRKVFANAFGLSVRLDSSEGKVICLRVAKEFPDLPEDQRKQLPIMQSLQRLDDQGDGFLSFSGIALSVLLASERLLMIDEPEAFLHPAQSRELGRWIAELMSKAKGQAILVTHDPNFLEGVVSQGGDVSVIRVARDGDANKFVRMAPEGIKKLASSPLLISQKILESLFFKGVILTEGESDRIVYQAVASVLGLDSEIKFVSGHNKQSLHSVVRLFKSLGVPVIAIADFDVFNSEKEFTRLVEAVGTSSPEKFAESRQMVASFVGDYSDEELRETALASLKKSLEEVQSGTLGPEEIDGKVAEVRKSLSKWRKVKKLGLNYFKDNEEQWTFVNDLLSELKQEGLYIVPVGELESWFGVSKGDPERISKALETVSAEQAPVELREFIGSAANSVSSSA